MIPITLWVSVISGLGRDMLKVSALEFQRDLARYQDAAHTQPVVITSHGRENTVLISAEEYHRLKRRDRQVMGPADFTDADIAALEASRPPLSSRLYDDELSD